MRLLPSGSDISRQRIFTLCAIAAASTGVFLIAYQVWIASGGSGPYDRTGAVIGQDFLAFYTGWRLLLAAPQTLYDLAQQQQFQRTLLGQPAFGGIYAYINPPTFAALFAPLGLLPYRWAYVAWELLGGLALIASLSLLRPLLPHLSGRRWWIALAFIISCKPFFDVISDGQNTFFSLLVHVLILRAMLQKRSIMAGMLIGVGLLKPQLFITLLPLALLIGGWPVLVGFTIVAAIQGIVSLLLVGVNGLMQYLWLVQAPLADAFASHAWKKYSWDAFFTLLSGQPDGAARTVTLVACAGSYIWLLWVWRRSNDIRLNYSATLWALLLIIPHGSAYAYDLFLLVPAALLLINAVLEKPARSSERYVVYIAVGVIGLIYVLVAFDTLSLALGWQPVVVLEMIASLAAGWLAIQRRKLNSALDVER